MTRRSKRRIAAVCALIASLGGVAISLTISDPSALGAPPVKGAKGAKDGGADASRDGGPPGDAGTASNQADLDDGGAPEDGGSTGEDAGEGDAGDGGGSVVHSCTEHVPTGAVRPDVAEVVPERGLSGYAIPFVVIVGHGKGETVLPEGFRIRTDSDTGHALETAGFVVPDQAGGSPASITREEKASGATTKITIPIVPLPAEAGRSEMTIPSLPIAVQRANGEFVTVCTRPQRLLIEDPTSNEADPKVKPNPPPRSQREEWELARQLTIGIAIGLVAAAIGALIYRYYSRRPKPEKKVPQKPPWVVAFAELAAIRESDLLEHDKNDVYYERVSHTVRKYLGARYGFDGLERTTDEMQSILRRIKPPIEGFAEIIRFLEDSDLVKFARATPSEEDCRAALARGQTIVHMTMPAAVITAPPLSDDKEAT